MLLACRPASRRLLSRALACRSQALPFHRSFSNIAPTNPPADDVRSIPLPPKKAQVTMGTSMQIVPLGFGVGSFELEIIRGAPQLSPDVPEQTHLEAGGAIGNAASRFDLSFIPAPAEASDAPLRSSWAIDETATSSMEPKLKAEQRKMEQQPSDDPHALRSRPDPFASLLRSSPAAAPQPPAVSQRAPVPSSSSSSSLSASSPGEFMPQEMRIVVHSSIVLYQNFVFCWSPSEFSDITPASLSFLRVMTPRPELVLLGCGNEMDRRLPDEVTAVFRELGIGVEAMATGNAIATYNILTDEGRTVLAALLMTEEEVVKPRKLTRSEEMRKKLGYWQP